MGKPTDLVQGTLDLLILKTLSLEPKHGWAIAKRIQQISNDVLKVQQGSLYPALYRIEKEGWITAEWRATAFILLIRPRSVRLNHVHVDSPGVVRLFPQHLHEIPAASRRRRSVWCLDPQPVPAGDICDVMVPFYSRIPHGEVCQRGKTGQARFDRVATSDAMCVAALALMFLPPLVPTLTRTTP